MPEKTSSTRRRLLQQSTLAAGAALAAQKLRAQSGGSADSAGPAWKRLFPAGFKNEQVQTSGATINVVTGGDGPPVLMMHGAPQSLVTWHLVAPELARDYKLVMIDLRGYGDSSKPENGENHVNYSKRSMALDGVEVMRHYGFDKFMVVGHDRGGRVGRRLALDHADNVTKLAVLDIVPAHYLYSHVTKDFATAYWHWFFFIQREPMPETFLNNSWDFYFGRGKSETAKEYQRTFKNPKTVHAMLEDYRASASIDLEYDKADEQAGKKIQCPVLTLWAAKGAMGRQYDVLGIWKEEGVNVTGKGLPGNHSLQESAPKETLEELQTFLRS
jgi:haloacetate dehalogenase